MEEADLVHQPRSIVTSQVDAMNHLLIVARTRIVDVPLLQTTKAVSIDTFQARTRLLL